MPDKPIKILMFTRLMSGFVSSVEAGKWRPAGTPAIYRMINYLDHSQHQLDLVFAEKTIETSDVDFDRALSLNGLQTSCVIYPGPGHFSQRWGFLRTYFSEVSQAWKVYRRVKKTKPDIFYTDRSNVLTAAVIARWTSTPVHLRLLGTPPSLETMLTKPALSHYLFRWAYRSPFKMVLCSRDGSPGATWMQRALNPETPRKRWVNGVDAFETIDEKSQAIRVVLIGRLNPLKRIDKAVDALLQLPEESLKKIHVDIIGVGEQFVKIKSAIKNSGHAAQFTLHGAIPHEQVLSYLANSDIFISLNTHGNLTNTVLEAIRCGLCLMLPQADKQTGVDEDTYTVLPCESVVTLSHENLLSDLKEQLEYLVANPKEIRFYQQKVREISVNIQTWDQRIENEVQLLQPYDLAIVISDLRGGGTQRVLERLLDRWTAQNKRIALITLDSEEHDKVVLPEMVDRIVLGGVGESANKLIGMMANFMRLLHLRRTLKRIKAPTVISFLSMMNVLTTLATRGMGSRLIISERNDPARQSFGKVWDFLRQKCYSYADIVTANSHSALQSLQQFVQQDKCHYVPNPLVLPEQVEPMKLSRPTILAVGRLHIQKAYDVLLEAFALFHKQHSDWQLVILGEGVLRSALEQQIQVLKLTDAVKMPGFTDPFPYYAAADIFTMPSRYEGMPNALLEAMAMGMPPVISDALEGPLDFITHQENALLVPVGNASALADAFASLTEQPELRQRIAEQARQSIAPFAMDQVLPQWEVLFNA